MVRHIKACSSCHTKKIKCDGDFPCQRCRDHQIQCRPHTRKHRKSRTSGCLSAQRISEPLKMQSSKKRTRSPRVAETAASASSLFRAAPPVISVDQDLAETEFNADISVLALNATGDVRYLGPSSGCLFAKYAMHFARELGPWKPRSPDPIDPASTREDFQMTESEMVELLSLQIRMFLLRSYIRWIQPVYYLFEQKQLENLMRQLPETRSNGLSATENAKDASRILSYLVMSLGAVTAEQQHVEKESMKDVDFPAYQIAASGGVESGSLFNTAINILDRCPALLDSKLFMIQFLTLVSIYSSYRPTGDSVWQISGIAIRMALEIGLHRESSSNDMSIDASEFRRRLFWTAYTIEIAAAFNLGRPPSLNPHDIKIPMPCKSHNTTASLHITHRKIQHEMMIYVYAEDHLCAVKDIVTNQYPKIDEIAQKLDNWRTDLQQLLDQGEMTYPFRFWDRLYHSTMAALHRPSPYCRSPSISSWIVCFKSSTEVISIHYDMIKNYRIPHTWMLVQGLILSTITALVCARLKKDIFKKQLGHVELVCIINDFVREASVALAVISERWSADLLNSYESLLANLAKDTIAKIAQKPSNNPGYTSSLTRCPSEFQIIPTPGASSAFQLEEITQTANPDDQVRDADMFSNDLFETTFANGDFNMSSLRDNVFGEGNVFDMLVPEMSMDFLWDNDAVNITA